MRMSKGRVISRASVLSRVSLVDGHPRRNLRCMFYSRTTHSKRGKGKVERESLHIHSKIHCVVCRSSDEKNVKRRLDAILKFAYAGIGEGHIQKLAMCTNIEPSGKGLRFSIGLQNKRLALKPPQSPPCLWQSSLASEYSFTYPTLARLSIRCVVYPRSRTSFPI